MAEALRWLRSEERGASPALLLRFDAYGPLPIAARDQPSCTSVLVAIKQAAT